MSEKINVSPTSRASKNFYERVERITNPKKLTIEQVKHGKKFKNISDEDAKEIIDGLYKLSIISYNIFMYGSGKIND